jgi:hypothetical protein
MEYVMRPTNSRRWAAAIFLLTAAAAATTQSSSAASPKFFDDDPIATERPTQDAAGVKPNDIALFVDLAYNVISGFGTPVRGRARNINTVDEVPDSAWFTNRIGRRPITPREIAIGPDATAGPADGTWTVTSSKSDGVTPGFTIRDAHGDRWFLKFDPPGYRAMATGTEVAVTKLMWALGYNVPENHIAYLRREQIVVSSEASYTPAGGRKRRMRASDLDALLARADREPDGSYRVVASKALPGTPVGRIRFFGVRPDDPNDIVPHEDRRELRAYGVFAAWLNHVDAKAINSLDTLVTENGRSYVRHHLIDFGSALGSGGVGPADYSAGREYLVEPRLIASRMVAFGVRPAEWQTEAFYASPAIGRMVKDQSAFDADRWKPRVPNQAFLHARADDRFWAARRLMSMTTDLLRAAVHSGEFGDAEAEAFLVHALAQRRDAIVRKYVTAVNPIADPVLTADGTLTFTNVAVDADVTHAPQRYVASWSQFDNATQVATHIGETTSGTTTLSAPAGLPTRDGAFIRVALHATDAAHPAWSQPVHAYFRLRGGEWRLVGFERMPDAA